VIEARLAISTGDQTFYVPPSGTFYSCAYSCQAGRIAAFTRVQALCAGLGRAIITYSCGQRQPAYWQ